MSATIDRDPASAPRDLVVLTWNGKDGAPPFYQPDAVAEFDIIVFDFTGTATATTLPCRDFLSHKVGGKSEIFAVMVRHLRETGARYDYIGLLDDDIEVTTTTLNRCFVLARELGLDSFAPSLSADSYYSWANTRNRPGQVWHAVDCVEVMVPFYRADLFLAAAPFYGECISGYGVDRFVMMLHQKILGCTRSGVLDAVTVRHNRPIQSNAKVYANGRTAPQERDHVRRLCMDHVAAEHPRLLGTAWFMRCFADLGGPARYWGPWLVWPWLALRGLASRFAGRPGTIAGQAG